MELIPTSLSARLHPFFSLLDEIGVHYWGDLAPAGIPWTALEKADVRYSLPAAYTLLERYETREGVDDLAFRGATRERFSMIEPGIRQHFLSACTLMVALSRYALLVRRYNGRAAGLAVDAHYCWFRVQTTEKVASETWNRFSDWSNLAVPLGVAREALGPSWAPAQVRLQSRVQVGGIVRETFPNCDIRTGMSFTGFSIPVPKLSWRMRPFEARDHKRPIEGETSTFTTGRKEIGPYLAELVAPLLAERKMSVQLAAELASTSVRSLQRQLTHEGTSWRDVLTKARFEHAARLLRETECPILEISMDLGYSDPSHFARAFRRLTGVSPRAYRAAHSPAVGQASRSRLPIVINDPGGPI